MSLKRWSNVNPEYHSTLLGKPLDYIVLLDAAHMPVKRWEETTSHQGAVDCFLFWLKNQKDPDPVKDEQYARWRELRNNWEPAKVHSKDLKN